MKPNGSLALGPALRIKNHFILSLIWECNYWHVWSNENIYVLWLVRVTVLSTGQNWVLAWAYLCGRDFLSLKPKVVSETDNYIFLPCGNICMCLPWGIIVSWVCVSCTLLKRNRVWLWKQHFRMFTPNSPSFEVLHEWWPGRGAKALTQVGKEEMSSTLFLEEKCFPVLSPSVRFILESNDKNWKLSIAEFTFPF